MAISIWETRWYGQFHKFGVHKNKNLSERWRYRIDFILQLGIYTIKTLKYLRYLEGSNRFYRMDTVYFEKSKMVNTISITGI